MRISAAIILLALVVSAACAPATPSPGQSPSRSDQAGPAGPPKAVTVAITEDPGNFWDAITGGGGSGVREMGHMVNQFLTTTTADGTAVPRLLSELPSVDRGTWQVLPDGGMQTTFKLRRDAVWHDGEPLTAEDIVFSWRVNRDPEIPNSNAAVVRLITAMEVQDPGTLVATWSEPYPYADRISFRELFTLPQHLLGQTYQETKDQLLGLPYFSEQYVGLGPYRVTRWERGAGNLELQAFDRYFLGRPKIDTMRVVFVSDPNALIANLKAHTIQSLLPPGGPDFETMALLKQEWEASRYGVGQVEIPRWKFMEPQKLRNPRPADLAEIRARQALLHAVNRAELARATYGEYGEVADSWVHPSFKQYPQIQDAISRYPYDPRRASAILSELGWQPGGDGVLEKGGQRFALTIRDRDDPKEALIIADFWKQIGVVATFEQQSNAELRDRQARAQFTGMEISRGSMPPMTIMRSLNSEAIPTPENRWAGSNRGGYANPAWDDLGKRLLSTLEEPGRVAVEREMVRMLTAELPLLPVMYDPELIVSGGGLTNMQIASGTSHNGQIMRTWNVHEWDTRPSGS
jgi:peptide/nickel transport system substrate-binding protein